ncbi:phosphatidylinositol 4-kinase, putative [Plasmodium vinckei brucechwatti]|uniref:1-phosphatidylinositol 4-kinase n=1 Tax=Plasmodium vinckei brucechwatti TaxID=119398 RepID=A0A6V7RZ29_PLAVN|nr:phosphatidylinositol 4-kinase, putative [Plasmodium vinckei brucechwatti]
MNKRIFSLVCTVLYTLLAASIHCSEQKAYKLKRRAKCAIKELLSDGDENKERRKREALLKKSNLGDFQDDINDKDYRDVSYYSEYANDDIYYSEYANNDDVDDVKVANNDNDENYENNKNETNPSNGNESIGRDDCDNKPSFSRSTLKEGSLLRRFRCESFDTHLHIRYLYDRKEAGVHEYLVNSLYTQRNPEDILFYLPQLCQISLVRYESSPLYRFLLDKASKSMDFALKLNWIYNSIVEDNIPKYKEISQKMIQKIEMAVVNCKPLNSECKIFKEDKQTDILLLANPLLFKRKFIIKKIRTNEKKKKNKNKNKPLSPQIPSSYIINSGPLTVSSAKIKLPSTYAKLGDPLSFSECSLPDCNYGFDMIEELQQFFMKQRRYDYFSLLKKFINLLITTSNLLANETDIDARNTLLNKFLYSLNTWMVMRRCIVASCGNIFSMTGLCIPMESISASKSDICESRGKQKKSPKHLQILHFINDECKILFSKKRAPYLLVFEVADLDEDISHISDNTLFNIENDKNNNLFKTTQNSEKESGVKSYISGDEYSKNEKSDDELKHNSYILTKNYGGYNENGSSYECEMKPSYEEQISKLNSNTNSADDEPSEVSSTNSSLNYFKDLNVIKMNDLYVYNAIVNDLKRENLISFTSEDEENIYLIKKCIGLAKEKSNNGYSDKEYDNNEMERRKLRKQNSNDNKNEINSTSNESSAIGIKTNKFITTRSVSMPNYLNNSKPADNNKNGENSNICEYNEAIANFTDNQTTEQDEKLKKTNQESGETYDKNDKKKKKLIKRVGNNNNGESSGKQANVLSSHPHNTRNCYSSVELPSVLPDISEYFKVENYLNEEFKKKNCKIIKTLLWGELFEDKKKKIRKISPYGKLKSWDLKCAIVKGGDDLRQELLASQLIKQFKIIFDNAGLPLWLRPYEILVTGSNSGIIEYVHDTCSDRNNGNMLLDSDGHLIHIDYEFMLTNSPGNMNFEASPFKLTQEYLDIMDGENSENFEYFRRLMVSGFLEARKHSEEIILLVELMMPVLKMPCFSNGTKFCIDSLKERFMINLTVDQCIQRINALIDASINNIRSVLYDYYQRVTSGII